MTRQLSWNIDSQHLQKENLHYLMSTEHLKDKDKIPSFITAWTVSGREPQVASGTRRQAPVVVSKKPVSSATHHKKMNSAHNLSELGNSFSLV